MPNFTLSSIKRDSLAFSLYESSIGLGTDKAKSIHCELKGFDAIAYKLSAAC